MRISFTKNVGWFTKCYLLVILLTIAPSRALFAQEQNYLPGEIIVMLSAGAGLDAFREQFSGTGLDGAPVIESLSPDVPVYLVKHEGISGREGLVVSQMQSLSTVYACQLNYKVNLRLTPNDTSFGEQWGLHNTGQAGGTPDADIDAPEAWNISTGGVTAAGDTIVAAIIDDGFQLAHPDLSPNMWVNYDEIPANGIDDDNNGYIDDVNGWNAYNNNGNLTAATHGTHVAGIIGARGNNTTGITGVNWRVKIMPIAGSSGSTSTVIAAYGYALRQRKLYDSTAGDRGAFVVVTNSSFGVDFGLAANFPVWCAFYDSLGAAGILSVGATANANTNVDVQGDIPTSCTSNYLVTVTNATRTDQKNTNAGYGANSIDLGAPGTSIYSTVTGNAYNNLSGTSMATPMVAGIIALMYSYPCVQIGTLMHSNPSGFALMVKEALLDGVNQLPAFAGITVSGGRANAANAMDSLARLCSTPLPVLLHSYTAKLEQCRVHLQWTVGGTGAATFLVEAGKDGRNFDIIGEQQADMSGDGIHTYSEPYSGNRFYRIRIMDADGAHGYSKTIELVAGNCGNDENPRVFPNPLKSSVLELDGIAAGQVIELIDIYGKRVFRQMATSSAERADVGRLPAGIYFVRILKGDQVIFRQKLVRM